MGDGRGELDGGIALAAAPELTHDDMQRRAALERFKRPGVRFNRTHQAMLAAKFGEVAVVIFGKQIRDGPAHVPEKAFGHFGMVHDAAGERGQKLQWIVTATFPEFLAEIFRPVLAADFVAVDQ